MIYGGIYLPKINQCGVHASISGNRKYTYKIESQCLNKKKGKSSSNGHGTAFDFVFVRIFARNRWKYESFVLHEKDSCGEG